MDISLYIYCVYTIMYILILISRPIVFLNLIKDSIVQKLYALTRYIFAQTTNMHSQYQPVQFALFRNKFSFISTHRKSAQRSAAPLFSVIHSGKSCGNQPPSLYTKLEIKNIHLSTYLTTHSTTTTLATVCVLLRRSTHFQQARSVFASSRPNTRDACQDQHNSLRLVRLR